MIMPDYTDLIWLSFTALVSWVLIREMDSRSR
jgi:hypothetical protein